MHIYIYIKYNANKYKKLSISQSFDKNYQMLYQIAPKDISQFFIYFFHFVNTINTKNTKNTNKY